MIEEPEPEVPRLAPIMPGIYFKIHAEATTSKRIPVDLSDAPIKELVFVDELFESISQSCSEPNPE